MTLLLSDSDVRAVCDIGAMTGYLDQALRKEAKGSGAEIPERLNLAHGSVFLRVMPALLPESGLLGLKFFHGSMNDGVRYVVAVCSLETGAILGLIDAAYLTAARTGATSGVATRWLAREDMVAWIPAHLGGNAVRGGALPSYPWDVPDDVPCGPWPGRGAGIWDRPDCNVAALQTKTSDCRRVRGHPRCQRAGDVGAALQV